MVVVLATDGLPTDCAGGRGITGTTPEALDDTVAVATEGFTGPSKIQTFVIGVFAAAETDAQTNLDRVAVAGGTKNAYVITYGSDASSNVQGQFIEALNEIRAARLGCEFQIPQPTSGQMLSYSEVNVELTDAQQQGKTLFYVTPTGCTGADDEWHYDCPSARSHTQDHRLPEHVHQPEGSSQRLGGYSARLRSSRALSGVRVAPVLGLGVLEPSNAPCRNANGICTYASIDALTARRRARVRPAARPSSTKP